MKWWGIVLVVCAGCGGGAPKHVVAAEGPAPAERSSAPPAVADASAVDAYPSRYAVENDDVLGEKEAAAEKKNPGWRVELFPVGFLSMASYGQKNRTPGAPPTLESITAEDRARAEAFIAQNQDIVGGQLVEMTKKSDTPRRIFYQQVVDGAVVSWLAIDKAQGELHISGHFWPRFVAPKATKTDDELRAALDAVDVDGRGLPMKRQVHLMAPKPANAVEVHVAACFDRAPARSSASDPLHAGWGPCVDVTTGEPLTKGVAMHVTTSATNGVVSSRRHWVTTE